MSDLYNKKNILYFDNEGNIIIVRRHQDSSYSFYSTKIKFGSHPEVESVVPISDIFDYLETHKLDINLFGKRNIDSDGNTNGNRK